MEIIKKIFEKLELVKLLFYVEYRLTTLDNGKFVNTYSLKRLKPRKGCTKWSLYKKGPFFLPERLIDEKWEENSFESEK